MCSLELDFNLCFVAGYVLQSPEYYKPENAVSAQFVLSLFWGSLTREAALFQGGNLLKHRKQRATIWTTHK